MAARQIADHYHLSLSIGKALWDDLVGAALPYKVQEGRFDLGRLVHKGVKQLHLRDQVRSQVSALLEDREPPAALVQARDKAAELWQANREKVFGLIDDAVHVDGDWTLEVDSEGTEFHYADQKIGVDAHVKAVVTGKVHLLRKNVEVPFRIEKRLGAACHLGDIRFDAGQDAVVGTVQDPAIDLGDHAVLRLLNEAAGWVLAQQVERFSAVPVLKRSQVEELVAPAGGPLRVQMGVEDVAIDVSEHQLTLKVRFGFKQKQLTDAEDRGARRKR